MGSSLLTVDVGNSATKLRCWQADSGAALVCTLRADLVGAPPDAAAAADFFARARAVDLAAITSVADEALTAAWCAAIARATGKPAFSDLDCGLEIRTLEPQRVGRDRLFAARGALEWIGESAVVIDIGTALTVDALLAGSPAMGPRGWRRGSFLGGAIAPGPALQARALAAGTARLFEVVPEADPAALGRDSAAAMRAGIGVGIRGAVRELSSEIAREAGLVDPPIALTGGARAFARTAFAQRRVFEHEDLVHLGLCAAMLERAGLPRPSEFGPS